MIVKLEYYPNMTRSPNYDNDTPNNTMVKLDKIGKLYVEEVAIDRIENRVNYPTFTSYTSGSQPTKTSDYFTRVYLKNGDKIVVKNITYPTDSQVSIESVNTNQNFYELSSVLNKLDETLNKLLDKDDWLHYQNGYG